MRERASLHTRRRMELRDSQLSGPMHRWSLRHEIHAESRNGIEGTLIHDRIEFEIGFGWAGNLLERFFILPAMRKGFERRQVMVQRALLPSQRSSSLPWNLCARAFIADQAIDGARRRHETVRGSLSVALWIVIRQSFHEDGRSMAFGISHRGHVAGNEPSGCRTGGAELIEPAAEPGKAHAY